MSDDRFKPRGSPKASRAVEVPKPPAMVQIGTDRWLWTNGVIAESIKQNLLAFGHLAHPHVRDVELIVPEDVDADDRRWVLFRVALLPKHLKRYLRYKRLTRRLAGSNFLLVRWLLLKILQRNAPNDIDRNIRRMVRDYLGPEVPVRVEVSPWQAR